ncbi:MAG TPA: hypothetical protein VFA60_15090, partial [Terriglobales bacterium]|nr:hypothetical protein [Terriglobales bacterium]
MSLQLSRKFLVAVFISAVTLNASGKDLSPAPTPHESIAPYWTVEPGWDTELQIKNNMVAASLTVTPVLRLNTGAEYPLDPVTIAPSDVTSIHVSDALSKKAPDLVNQVGAYGSVVFRYVSSNVRNLYAVAMIHMTGQPIGFHIDAYAAATGWEVGSREGIWWLPRETAKDFLIVTNESDKPVPVRLSVFDAQGAESKNPLMLAPGQTQRFVVRDLLRQAGLQGTYGGIKIDAAAKAGSIDTVHFSYDETVGFA